MTNGRSTKEQRTVKKLVEALNGMLRRYHEQPGTYTPEGAAARRVLQELRKLS